MAFLTFKLIKGKKISLYTHQEWLMVKKRKEVQNYNLQKSRMAIKQSKNGNEQFNQSVIVNQSVK